MSDKLAREVTFLGTRYPFDVTPGGITKSIVNGQAITADSDYQIDIPTIDVSRLLFVAVWADGDMTVKFNSSSVPAPSMSLKANKPYIWIAETGTANSGYAPCLFLADVTKAYCTGTVGKKLYVVASFNAVA